MTKEYEAYIRRCSELGAKPLPEYTPLRFNSSAFKWTIIILAAVANMAAYALKTILKSHK